MPDIKQILNDEIRRLARKEVIALEKELKSQLVDLRKTVAAQNRKIKTLEKALAGLLPIEPIASQTENMPEDAEKSVRVTPERITKWRQQLGMKQAQYAALLDVSPLSVSNWESGKTIPREAQKRRIAALRDMGKREIAKLCQAKGIKYGKAAE